MENAALTGGVVGGVVAGGIAYGMTRGGLTGAAASGAAGGAGGKLGSDTMSGEVFDYANHPIQTGQDYLCSAALGAGTGVVIGGAAIGTARACRCVTRAVGKTNPTALKPTPPQPPKVALPDKGPVVAPRTIGKIGDLTKDEAAALRRIWEGGPRSQLPLQTREQLAQLYSSVAKSNPTGSAQSAFNQARADYLLGRGPNPGKDVNAFAERMGLPKFRRQ